MAEVIDITSILHERAMVRAVKRAGELLDEAEETVPTASEILFHEEFTRYLADRPAFLAEDIIFPPKPEE